MRALTSLALSTLAVNWTLTVLAFMAVTAIYCNRLVGLSMGVQPDDILILVSFVVSVVLVSLSTWTILDEGQAEHQGNVSGSQLELAAKVSPDSFSSSTHAYLPRLPLFASVEICTDTDPNF